MNDIKFCRGRDLHKSTKFIHFPKTPFQPVANTFCGRQLAPCRAILCALIFMS